MCERTGTAHEEERLEMEENDGEAYWLQRNISTGLLQAKVGTGELSRNFSCLKDSSWKVLDLSPKEAPSFFRCVCVLVYCINICTERSSMAMYVHTYSRHV
jgi:hypothetical protein